MRLIRSIGDAGKLIESGESDTLELKRTTGELPKAMKTLCGFLNNRGGAVLFGVTPSGKIVGQNVTDNTLHDVTTAVRNIEPAAHVDVYRLELDRGHSIVVMSTAAGSQGPYTYDGRPFIRVGNTTRRMKREEYERLVLARLQTRHRWETLAASGWKIADLDAEEIRQTVVESVAANRLSAVPSEAPKTILGRLGLLVDGSPTQAAVVLFAKEPLQQFPQCAIRLARFRGVTKSEFMDNRQFHGHAFSLLRHARTFLDMHVPIASRIVPGKMRREDRPAYPAEALREALVNAICHRDYSEQGASIGLSLYDDRLEVWSWGRLPGELTPQMLREDHPSIRRNDLISDVFYRRGYIEKWGRGTQKIIELCKGAGLPEPEFLERSGEVGVRFRAAEQGVERVERQPLTPREQEVLTVVTELGLASAEEIRQRLQKPPGLRRVQRLLSSLVQGGQVETEGRGKSTKYRRGAS